MDFAGYLRKGVQIVRLDGDAAAEAARDEQALAPGLAFIAIGGAALGVSNLLLRHGTIGGVIGGPVGALVGYFAGVGILHLVATVFFGGRGEYLALLRAEALASILSWAGVFPVLGALASLWHLPVTVVILERVYAMPRARAIATVGAIVGFFLLLGLIASAFFGAALVAFLAGMTR